MLTIKNRAGSALVKGAESSSLAFASSAGFLLLLALLAGCTPPGPRALREGKRLIDQEQYPQAIEALKSATVLLGGTNALAWNGLGVAYQHVGADAEAESAYRRALALDRDFSEVRFNLGCLWLEQNKLDAAKAEFIGFTLRQPAVAEGFLKLGATQLRARELGAAEKSFNEALRLNPQSPEALNWLGLVRLQRGRAGEAAEYFESALKQKPLYRPALLNLAIVSQQYLRDRQLALQKYQEYLALKPPPANAGALAAIVQQLEQELNPPVRPPAANAVGQLYPSTIPARPSATSSPKPLPTNVPHLASAPKPEPGAHLARPAATNPPKPATTIVAKRATAAATAPPENVEVPKPAGEPVPNRTLEVSQAPPASLGSPAEPLVTTSSVSAGAAGPSVAKRSFFQRINPFNLFRAAEPTPARAAQFDSSGRSPQEGMAKTDATAPEPAGVSPPGPAPKLPTGRYAYKSPPEPSPGNRAEAVRAFAKGVQAQQAHRLPEAMHAYRLAAKEDPSLYEAQYNLGLAATDAGDLSLALTAYENALAIRPNSLDARYNFALVLKQANYLLDAVNELEKIVAAFPNETRAHLALGNLYAQQLGEPAKARPHYLKVLEVEPHHPQGTVIRYWLAAH